MEELGAEVLELTGRVASGERSVGEKAGHAQVQIWRNWAINTPINLAEFKGKESMPLNGTAIDYNNNGKSLLLNITITKIKINRRAK